MVLQLIYCWYRWNRKCLSYNELYICLCCGWSIVEECWSLYGVLFQPSLKKSIPHREAPERLSLKRAEPLQPVQLHAIKCMKISLLEWHWLHWQLPVAPSFSLHLAMKPQFIPAYSSHLPSFCRGTHVTYCFPHGVHSLAREARNLRRQCR